jgi:hypothetical protein
MSSLSSSSSNETSQLRQKRDRDDDGKQLISLWDNARQGQPKKGSDAMADAEDDELCAVQTTPYDYFGARKEWLKFIREKAPEQSVYSRYNPTMIYCFLHKRFTGSEVPEDQRDGDCAKCIANRTKLMEVDYIKLAFPRSPFTKEGREKDRDNFYKLRTEMKHLEAKRDEKLQDKKSGNKAIMELEPKLSRAWHAYVLQVSYAGEEIRRTFPRERQPQTPEEKAQYEDLRSFVSKGVTCSMEYLGVNVFKVKCLVHDKIASGVPMSPLNKYDPKCNLCFIEPKINTTVGANRGNMFSSSSKGRYETEQVGGTSYFKLS